MVHVGIVATAVAVRAGLKALLLGDEGIQVVAEAATLAELEDDGVEAEVILWSPGSNLPRDTLLPEDMNAQSGDAPALLLVGDDPKAIEKLRQLNLRAWGMLSTESSQAELIAAVNALNEGLVVVNPLWVQYLTSGQAAGMGEEDEMIEALTGREMEILQLLALGLTNKQVAVKLGISAHTVKFHVSSIFSKMRTTNRTETVKLGLRRGLILL